MSDVLEPSCDIVSEGILPLPGSLPEVEWIEVLDKDKLFGINLASLNAIESYWHRQVEAAMRDVEACTELLEKAKAHKAAYLEISGK